MDWTSGAQSPVRWQVSDLCLAPEQPSQHLHEAVINSFPTPYTCKVTFLRSRQRLDCDKCIIMISDVKVIITCYYYCISYSTYWLEKLDRATFLYKQKQNQN